ncbi:NADPH-dependent oxidoreductase [Mesobacillus maritimus]|uniref:NADPH-dependent oxidoreductase n=1 Tax=Mesobacillus maritimus TaxID=1643336 RepID=UPI00384DBAD1
MNETIRLLKNHRSIREFDPEKEVSVSQTKTIIETAMAAPNWINGQQVSVIEIRDNDRKSKLAKAAGKQKWIEEAPVFFVFCLDFYRAKLAADNKGKKFQVADNIEAIIVGSTDVGIALANATVAAESMGLGIVPIGGIRRNPDTYIDALQLPEYVFPISGLVVGHPRAIPEQKPRLPLEAVHHKEKYNREQQQSLMDEYDQTVSAYMAERTNGHDTSNWSSKIVHFYDNGFEAYQKAVAPALKRQGFRYRRE